MSVPVNVDRDLSVLSGPPAPFALHPRPVARATGAARVATGAAVAARARSLPPVAGDLSPLRLQAAADRASRPGNAPSAALKTEQGDGPCRRVLVRSR